MNEKHIKTTRQLSIDLTTCCRTYLRCKQGSNRINYIIVEKFTK